MRSHEIVTSTRPGGSSDTLTLQQVSARLGLHYMTVYRYVRTGRLPAVLRDGVWQVAARDLPGPALAPAKRFAGRGRTTHPERVPQLLDRLIAGDEAGAWTLLETVLAGGTTPSGVYLELLVPALRLLGELWERGDLGIADEHITTGIVQRLVGRMGPLFRRPGKAGGIMVLGAPEGEAHSLPVALAADLLRGRGIVVVDLGANVPTGSFLDCVTRLPRVTAVGVAVTWSGHRDATAGLLAALRDRQLAAKVVVGGGGIAEADALGLGADAWARDAPGLLSLMAGAA